MYASSSGEAFGSKFPLQLMADSQAVKEYLAKAVERLEDADSELANRRCGL